MSNLANHKSEGERVLCGVRPPAQQRVFIDNTPLFVEIAENLGMNGIHHTHFTTTCAQLSALGLRNTEAAAMTLANPA